MATSTDLRAAIEEVQGQLPAEQMEGGLVGYAPDLLTRLERRIGALPWWVISATVHAVLFLLATLLTVAVPAAQVDEVTISSDVAKEKPPEYDQKKPRDIFRQLNEVQHETQVENPVVVHEEAEVTDHFETDNDTDANSARGQEDAISDIPLGGTGVCGSIGVGGGGMAGVFGYRNGGGRKRAVARFGGSKATESAVEAALAWLARHQDADGHWDTRRHGGNYKLSDVGNTGLAVLAFLGAGYTDKAGKYRDNVKRGLKWLMEQQADDGGFRYGYCHSIAGLALAEAYGMGKTPEVGEAAQKAVDYSVNVHQKPYSAWRYSPKMDPDTSVTGWFVMQLKSARVAGLKVDGRGFQGAQNYLDGVTRDGWTGYQGGAKRPSTTSVAMVCRQFMGVRNADPVLVKAAENIAPFPPVWAAVDKQDAKGPGGNAKVMTFYYWYYGTLAMFQMGGDHWNKWNPEMKKALLPNQRKGGPLDGSAQDVDGSWDQLGHLDKSASRVYTTALGALTLEVYYRYLPMYSR